MSQLDFQFALYTASTANGARPALMLTELGLPFSCTLLNLSVGEQKRPEFININPAASIPVLAVVKKDGEDFHISQSGAILWYLMESTGKLCPRDPAERIEMLRWFFQAIADVQPASGMLFYGENLAPEKSTSNTVFYRKRLLRFVDDVEARLSKHDYLCGRELTAADIALFPTIAVRRSLVFENSHRPALLDWYNMLVDRRSIAEGMRVAGFSDSQFRQ